MINMRINTQKTKRSGNQSPCEKRSQSTRDHRKGGGAKTAEKRYDEELHYANAKAEGKTEEGWKRRRAGAESCKRL